MFVQTIITSLVFLFFSAGISNTTDVLSSNDPLSVELTPVGNELKFEQTTFSVKAGQEIELTFNNTSTAMPHNVVLLNSASAVDRVGTAAMTVDDYIPEDDAILAYTAVAQPGETVKMTFTAPSEPGEYPYICTVPGHYFMMKGVMKVTE